MAPKSLATPATKPKAKAKPTKLPSPIQHPPYFQMISEAISSLKDRTGSSQQAIAKFIEQKYKNNLPANFKKLLSIQLKKFAKSEKLVKIKNSFKISATEKTKRVVSDNKEKNIPKVVAATAKKSEVKQKKAGVVKQKKTGAVKEKKDGSSKATKDGSSKVTKTKKLSRVSSPKRVKKTLAPKMKVVKSIKSPKRLSKKVKA